MKIELEIEVPDVETKPMSTKVECGQSYVFVQWWQDGWKVTDSNTSVTNVRWPQNRTTDPGHSDAIAWASDYVRRAERARLFSHALTEKLKEETS